MNIHDFEQTMLAYTLILPRLFACFIVLPILGKQVLGGTLVRNGVACSLALFIYPCVADTLPSGIEGLELAVLIGKEILIGVLVGFVVSIPFWAIEATGFIIDNQRGASMASTLNPLLASQTSPTGVLLTQTLITLFFSGGAFLAMLGALFTSYANWPIATFYPHVGSQWAGFFLGQFTHMLALCLVFAAPLLVAMFLAEFGLALVSRFAPSLNVFILSMPIKSLVSSLILVPYLYLLMNMAHDSVLLALDPVRLLGPVLEQP
ncbi:type III secretion system export apparatus subunit SctT [Pseudomonas sp. MWU13-3659]|uniref:type III secretion system export apparatus subunit SctT n=1 Tax=Pseudomonas sp. MWU13-3659 TaxID=2986964 RepID=UPI00207645CB|nr:type III secretion system export apparatus subunit SctT [Pseudomonas sp. MWU13-3659]